MSNTVHPLDRSSFKKARLRRLSRKLAEEVNPATLEAMRLANVELQNRIYALEDLQNAERELRAAVHEWFMREEEELVVDITEDVTADRLPQVSVTLHWLRENDKLALHYWAFERVLTGDLPRYLCSYCKDPKCGGQIVCKQSAKVAGDNGLTDQELIDHERQVWMPARVKKAMELVVEQRKRVGR